MRHLDGGLIATYTNHNKQTTTHQQPNKTTHTEHT